MRTWRAPAVLLSVLVPLALSAACGSERRASFDENNATPGFDDGGAFGDASADPSDKEIRDPKTCAEAAASRTYVGCDYWATPGANIVQDVFDFTIAVANVGDEPADVEVTGTNDQKWNITVGPGSLGKVFLPWIPELKGNTITSVTASTIAKGSAYHVVSNRPVVVYQFSPLQFRAQGGPPGKSWSACRKASPLADDCYSYSNDASLLLPSTAMTGNYRIMGSYGFSRRPIDESTQKPDPSKEPLPGFAPYFLVTATQNGTTVNVKLGAKGKVTGGGGVPTAAAGSTVTFTLDAGDIAQVVSGVGRDFDFSGSLLDANKPVQVITGVPCIDFPLDVIACDHIEETVFPAQTLGKHYVVPMPAGPADAKVAHVVRLYGNADGTKLTYKPSAPSGCPATLAAGEVVECGEVGIDFEVEGDHEFGVGTFLLGASKVDPQFSLQKSMGDPSQSFAVTVEQYRKKYVFLAPTDYTTSYVDVVTSEGTTLTLDGADVSAELTPIGGTSFFVARIKLAPVNEGVHTLLSSKPSSIQVRGYGSYTSYQYPGGLNLGEIAPIPPK
ncbi:MAG: IgGFc-binding protein [Labilithrix sp.]|nr:IgGFc-binding protein [Labilithrix sp.]